MTKAPLLPALLAVLLGSALSAGAQVKSDWERENEERLKQADEQVVQPPALDRKRLVELQLAEGARTDFRFYVDAGSVSVGGDRIVRYALVARSPSGVESVTFEGIRCPGEYRVYAVGRPAGDWAGRASEWRAIPRDLRLPQYSLSRHYFCIGRMAIPDRAEGERNLRAGGQRSALPGAP